MPGNRTSLLFAIFAIAAAASANAATLGRSDVRYAEQRLAELGYWVGPVDGTWDGASQQALIAFQKVQGARPTGVLTRAELDALAVATPFLPQEQGTGPRLEVDLARQVLYLVDAGGDVGNILPISSGSGRTFHEHGYPETRAITPCGHLEVYAKAHGWKASPLGQMHNPMYIVGGIAIHGSTEMRTYPASHGCIRIPMFASARLTSMVPTGTPVYVFGCSEESPTIAEDETVSTAAGGPSSR